jgi:hypothetical protein
MSVSYADVELARHRLRVHYVHTSHGEQIICGLQRIMAVDPTYKVAIGAGYLPQDTSALCIMDVQGTPSNYWLGGGIAQTRATLRANPSINVSAFMWCGELQSNKQPDTQGYLDAMASLEAEFPNVTFVYMTANCQPGDYAGVLTQLNNNLIRAWCMEGNRVLFDFADLDAWHNGGENRYWWAGNEWYWKVPYAPYHLETWVQQQHPDYAAQQCGHTTYESCELKGAAMWWLLVQVARELPPVSVKPATWGAIKAEYK